MEQHVAELELRRDGLIDQLNDRTLPPLDRWDIEQEMELLTAEIIELELIIAFENLWWAEEEDDASTLSLESSETIGDDEYDRDGFIANDDFDLGGEV